MSFRSRIPRNLHPIDIIQKLYMRAWHDYHLTAYSVHGVQKQITFDVSWPYDSPTDILRASVIFTGVEGYFFEHDLGENILYSIAEEPLDDFLATNAKHFEEQQKWGWPMFWRKSVEDTLTYLSEKQVKYFDISTSYGLSGWVLASGVKFHETTPE